MSADGDIEYTPEFIALLETTWGDGFLSPGGPAEVREVVQGLALEGSTVLDVGTGLGGPAMVLVRDRGVAQVTGIDVEAPVLAGARARIAAAGLDQRISLRQVAPGPLDFAASSFDVVFSKDTLVHIPDKPAFFREVLRVVRPGGWFAASNWFRSDAPFSPEMALYCDHGPLKFALATLEEGASALAGAGFTEVAARDRTDWFARETAREAAWAEGEGRAALIEAVGREASEAWIARTRLRAVIAAQGQLRPGHLRGRKPLAG